MRSRRFITRGGGALAVLVLVATFVAGAGQARVEKGAQTTTVTLAGWASSPEETSALNRTIASFERLNRNIDVEYTPISGDYDAAMLARFAAKRPPDVLYVDSLDVPGLPAGARAAERLHHEDAELVDEAVLPTPAQRVHGEGEDLRLPEGLVAARSDRELGDAGEGRRHDAAADLATAHAGAAAAAQRRTPCQAEHRRAWLSTGRGSSRSCTRTTARG